MAYSGEVVLLFRIPSQCWHTQYSQNFVAKNDALDLNNLCIALPFWLAWRLIYRGTLPWRYGMSNLVPLQHTQRPQKSITSAPASLEIDGNYILLGEKSKMLHLEV